VERENTDMSHKRENREIIQGEERRTGKGDNRKKGINIEKEFGKEHATVN
jgi:hypothetical protein